MTFNANAEPSNRMYRKDRPNCQISRAQAMGVSVATIGAARPPADFALVDSDGLLTNWMVKRACKGVLVRPDHIVYAAVSTEGYLTEAGPQ
jgi:hypothetical protein